MRCVDREEWRGGGLRLEEGRRAKAGGGEEG